MSQSLREIAVFGPTWTRRVRSTLPQTKISGFTNLGRLRQSIFKRKVDLTVLPVGAVGLTNVQRIVEESIRQAVPTIVLIDSDELQSSAGHFTLPIHPSISAAYDIKELPALVKLLTQRQAQPKGAQSPAPTAGASDEADILTATTAFLRDERQGGRLSVRALAQLYQVPESRFAAALQVTRAAVAQTPTSARYQNFLEYFERVARILPFIKDRKAFAAWAKTPNEEMGGASPLDLLFGSPAEQQRAVDVVEDFLTGQPD